MGDLGWHAVAEFFLPRKHSYMLKTVAGKYTIELVNHTFCPKHSTLGTMVWHMTTLGRLLDKTRINISNLRGCIWKQCIIPWEFFLTTFRYKMQFSPCVPRLNAMVPNWSDSLHDETRAQIGPIITNAWYRDDLPDVLLQICITATHFVLRVNSLLLNLQCLRITRFLTNR